MSDYRDEQIERDQREREERERQEEQRRQGHRSPSPHQSEGGSSMRWEWNLSGPGSFSVSRVLATVYRSGGVYAIIGLIAGFLLPGIFAVLIVMDVGTWTAGTTSEGSGSAGAGVFLLLGVVFLAFAIPIFVHRRRFVSRAASATGVVTDLKSTELQAGMQSYNPVVQFQTHDGRMVEFESDTGGPEESYPPGGQVEVLYDPLNPEKAHIKTFFMLWGIPLLFGGLGAVFLVVGVSWVLSL
jgi:hypothetical protein